MIGRGLDALGVCIVAVLVICPILAVGWCAVRLAGAGGGVALRTLAIGVSATAAISGIILVRVTRQNLRSFRNATKPRELTWRQYEVSERILYRAGQFSVAAGLLGIASAIPAHLY